MHEGYGRVNVDAAVDAVLKTYQVGTTASDSLGSPPTSANIAVLGQKLAWARNVQLLSGVQYNFSLTVPSGADFDLYLYNVSGSAYGEPIIVASSTTAATGGFENITYTPSLSGQYYIVVKRATETTSTGQFTLTSWPKQPVYLLLVAQPSQLSYSIGQSLTLDVEVLNLQNAALSSTSTVTVTGPGNYYYYCVQPVNVTADAVGEYSFTWNVPQVAGSYVVEVGLVPAQLNAYDSTWLVVGEP